MNFRIIFPIALSTLIISLGCSQEASQKSPIWFSKAKQVSNPPSNPPGDMLPSSVNQPCIPTRPKLSQSSCSQGELCVPKPGPDNQGVCMIECGEKISDRLVKNHKKCPKNWRCLAKKNSELTLIGNFCAKPQEHRDLPCEAPFDPDACHNKMSCLPTLSATHESGKRIFANFRCKEECIDDNQCQKPGESCLHPTYAQNEIQKSLTAHQVECSVKACLSKNSDCTCDTAQGFACESLAPKIDLGICLRPLGICGEAVPLAHKADFRGKSFVGPTCNETTDNRFCQNPFEKDSKLNPRPICSVLSSTREGACVSVCFVPSFELFKPGRKFKCPDNFACQDTIARKLDLYSFLKVKGSFKSCNFSKCTPGLPCPFECGSLKSECLEIKVGGKKEAFCGAPYGLCEPI